MPKIRVLLAEDDQDHRHLLSLALTEACADLELHVVERPEEFIQAVSGERFDAIILDYNLAQRRADCLIREAGSVLDGVPVVVVSSNEGQGVAIASFRGGVADFVPKSEATEGDILWRRVQAAIQTMHAQKVQRRRAARRERTLIRLAETDPLTKLPNRRAADRWLSGTRWQQDRRKHCSMVMLDIDHFKSVNDTFGHAGGDTVLKRVASTIVSMLSPGDLAVRWGGEEFLVIKGSTEGACAWQWADRVRRLIAERPIHVSGRDTHVTTSAGVATVSTSRMSAEAVTLADHALYLAKDRGRNRVCTWDMVKFERLATSLAEDVGTSDESRWMSFMTAGHAELGPVQIEHLVSHSRAVAGVAARIAEAMKLSKDYQSKVRLAGLLHDVGKCVIPESILSKSSALDAEEWLVMNQHATEGATLAEALGIDGSVVEGIREHHTRYDARPEHWPATLSELTASIVAVADALVTMTTHRPYRAAMSSAGAFRELQRNSGTQFHPVAVQAAQEMWRESRAVESRIAA